MLNPSLVTFEQRMSSLPHTKENDYKVQSGVLLLERVRKLMTQASGVMIGDMDAHDGVWDMEDIRAAKSEMIAKTRTA